MFVANENTWKIWRKSALVLRCMGRSRAKDAERSDEDNERSKDSFSNKISDQSAPRKNSASNHTINPYLQAISGLSLSKQSLNR